MVRYRTYTVTVFIQCSIQLSTDETLVICTPCHGIQESGSMKSIINDQVEYDSTRKSLKHRDTTIILSASTARLLELFIAHKNQQLHREFIIEEVWKKHGMAPSGHSLNKSISILRKAFSELGADNPIETLPRQGFLFHASVNDEQSSFSGDVPVRSVTETVNSPATPKRKNIVLFILLFAFLGSSVLILPALNSGATNFIYIRAIGDCELYTADDNNADKTKAFLSSDMWRKINATCHDGKKTIVFYDDNNLSAGNDLKENFLGICTLDKGGAARECENYLY